MASIHDVEKDLQKHAVGAPFLFHVSSESHTNLRSIHMSTTWKNISTPSRFAD